MFAIQFAGLAGRRVIATSGSDDKIARLAGVGVTETIHYGREPAWGDRARAIAGGDGVDQVIEVGGQGTLEQSLRAVRPGGTVSLIGTLAEPAPVNLTPVLMRNIRVQGVFVGSRAMADRLHARLGASALRPIIDRTFAFENAPAAFDYLAERRQHRKDRHRPAVTAVRNARGGAEITPACIPAGTSARGTHWRRRDW